MGLWIDHITESQTICIYYILIPRALDLPHRKNIHAINVTVLMSKVDVNLELLQIFGAVHTMRCPETSCEGVYGISTYLADRIY